MKSTSVHFHANARAALNDPVLQDALKRLKAGFVVKRREALEGLPDFPAMREAASALKKHILDHLDIYLEQYEAAVRRQGGEVHWAEDAEQARRIVADLCQRQGLRRVLKGKTMVGEEVGLNEELEAAGLEVVETDLGEYIIQLAKEPPSHIIAPAIHKTRGQVGELFSNAHDNDMSGANAPELVAEARRVMRRHFLAGEVGITGANFLIAETGSNIIVTNEGNGDLSATLPKMHIVVAGIEKVVPTLEDATLLLRILARSATGQRMTSYTTLHTGPKRTSDRDGPNAYHVVLVDNGRSRMLTGPYRDMLHCIRCGACLNHCPVYGAIGGHAYGWVYPGPMGSVLTPLITGLDQAASLPQASSLCGRCEAVCPVAIPLPRMLRELRFDGFDQGHVSGRGLLRTWAFLACRPRLYRRISSLLLAAARGLARRGWLPALPGTGAWRRARDLPAPAAQSFSDWWRRRQ
ncbi:MAG: iron-sulfur cluster-binding protein [Gammaproteobacteria bacterium]|nr:iron-sulfur cluster-binding protein [Gammaproteobacteria bacterium]